MGLFKIKNREELEAKGRINQPGYTGQYRKDAYGEDWPRDKRGRFISRPRTKGQKSGLNSNTQRK